MKSKNIVRPSSSTFAKDKSRLNKGQNIPEIEIKNSDKVVKEKPRWTKKMLESTLLKIPKNKILIHMYLDEDIVEWFRLEGRGYQTRINAVLKAYVNKKSKFP